MTCVWVHTGDVFVGFSRVMTFVDGVVGIPHVYVDGLSCMSPPSPVLSTRSRANVLD